jgi:hypothetical protein
VVEVGSGWVHGAHSTTIEGCSPELAQLASAALEWL